MANAVQQIAFSSSPTSGTYTLTFYGQTTGPINWNDDASTLQGDFDALSTVGSGNSLVSGEADTGEITITFQGALANINVPQVTCDASGLTGAGSIGPAVETQVGIAGTSDIWIVEWDDSGLSGTSFSLTIDSTPFPVSAMDSASNINGYMSANGITDCTALDIAGGDITLTFTAGAEHTVSVDGGASSSCYEDQAATPGVAEIQTIPVPGATGGTFTLEVSGVGGITINWNDTVAAVNGYFSDYGFNATATGTDGTDTTAIGPLTITWDSDGPQSLLTIDASGLTGGSVAATASTTQMGSPLPSDDSFNPLILLIG